MLLHRKRLKKSVGSNSETFLSNEEGQYYTDENGNIYTETAHVTKRSIKYLTDGDGVSRFYVKEIPVVRKKNLALIVFLHGGGGNGITFEYQMQLSNELKTKCVVAFLSGRNNTSPGVGLTAWNSGSVFNNGNLSNLLDINYIQSAIAIIASEHDIDPSKIYLCGHSNGAMMAHRAASEFERRDLTYKIAKYIALNGVITHNVQIDSLIVGDTGVEAYVYNKPVACYNGSLDNTVPPGGLAGFYITQPASKAIIQATAGIGSIFIDDLVCNHSMDQLDIGFANYTPNTDLQTRIIDFFNII